jgi:hypothetical protein
MLNTTLRPSTSFLLSEHLGRKPVSANICFVFGSAKVGVHLQNLLRDSGLHVHAARFLSYFLTWTWHNDLCKTVRLLIYLGSWHPSASSNVCHYMLIGNDVWCVVQLRSSDCIQARRPWLDSQQKTDSSLPYKFQTVLGASSVWRLFSSNIMRPEHEAYHWLPSSAEVKNTRNFISMYSIPRFVTWYCQHFFLVFGYLIPKCKNNVMLRTQLPIPLKFNGRLY